MFISLLRTIILYIFVVFIMRVMGKRQIGELQPFELAITIMISELASLPMQDARIPLIHGIIPIITLLALQVTFSLLELKSEKVRFWLCGKPSILIHEGKLDINQLRTQRYNLNDLLEEIRLQGYYNITDIEYAILETSGQLSIIPKTESSPATKKDMNIQSTQDLIPVTLILDGNVNHENLKFLGKDVHWLNQMLKENHVSSPKDVLIAILDSQRKFFFQPKERKEKIS